MTVGDLGGQCRRRRKVRQIAMAQLHPGGFGQAVIGVGRRGIAEGRMRAHAPGYVAGPRLTVEVGVKPEARPTAVAAADFFPAAVSAIA